MNKVARPISNGMDKIDQQKNIVQTEATPEEEIVSLKSLPAQPAPIWSGERTPKFAPKIGERRKNVRRISRRESRVKPEFDQKIIDIRRVARVVSGGRRFSFSVALVAGNRRGSVGVGAGKASDTALAIDKALRDAKKHMIKVNITKTMSIPHEVSAKYSSARVLIMPAKERGVIAGSSVRTVLELAGLKDVMAKLFSGSKNRVNNAQVAIKALSKLSQPQPLQLAAEVSKDDKKFADDKKLKTEKSEKLERKNA